MSSRGWSGFGAAVAASWADPEMRAKRLAIRAAQQEVRDATDQVKRRYTRLNGPMPVLVDLWELRIFGAPK